MSAILSSGLGAVLGERIVSIDTRMVLAFAAGIGAVNPLYLDDARSGGIVAPPSFIVSLEWPMLMSDAYLQAIGRDQATAFDTLVHGTQDSVFHRPVCPGDRLAVSGRIVAIQTTRAGTLVTIHLSTTHAGSGAQVADSWFGALYRGTQLDGVGGCIDELPTLRPDRGVPGPDTWREDIVIPRGQAHVYTECARIWNPIHTERSIALEQGLPDIILHGTCTWAMALQRLCDRYRPGAAYPLRRAATRFTRMVVPGTTVTVQSAAPDERGAIDFAVLRADGEIALGHALTVLA